MTVLVFLFAFQSREPVKSGNVFGPVILLWLATIALLGLNSIIHTPAVLMALNPGMPSVSFPKRGCGFVLLGAVFLAVTGGGLVCRHGPLVGSASVGLVRCSSSALLLNYYGQAALIFRSPEMIANPLPLPPGGRCPGRACSHCGDHRCLSGTHKRHLLPHAPGDIVGLPAAHSHSTYLIIHNRSDICSQRQPSLMFASVAWFWLSDVRRTCRSVRCGCDIAHADHNGTIHDRCPHKVELASLQDSPLAGLFLLFDVSFFLSALLRFLMANGCLLLSRSAYLS